MIAIPISNGTNPYKKPAASQVSPEVSPIRNEMQLRARPPSLEFQSAVAPSIATSRPIIQNNCDY